MPPRETVFNSPELLEAVLLQLPQSSLLQIQTVCRRWRYAINDSPALQQKLFLRPVLSQNRPPEINPLLRGLFPPLFRLQRCPTLSDLGDLDRWNMITIQEMRELDWFKNTSQRSRVLREDASWRSMFPVQPPAPIGKVIRGENCDGYILLEHAVISSQFESSQVRGAPMGLIYDVLTQELVDNPAGSIFVEWHMFPFSQGDDIEGEESVVSLDKSSSLLESSGMTSEQALKNEITLFSGSGCPTCDRSESIEDRTDLQIEVCEKELLKWTQILESG